MVNKENWYQLLRENGQEIKISSNQKQTEQPTSDTKEKLRRKKKNGGDVGHLKRPT